LNIPYEGFAFNYTNAALDTFALSLDVDFFSTLTEAQFNKLKATYCSSWWNISSGSQVRYTPGQSYTLTDFLPPAMQALSGKHFHAQEDVFALPYFVSGNEMKLKNQTCLFLINCWGFAYNMLYYSRLPSAEVKASGLYFSVASPTVAYSAFWDSDFFEPIQSSSQNQEYLTNESLRNANLQPGDVILIWHKNQLGEAYLDHVAIFIDDDLYYEKSGTGDDVPFRLNDYKGLTTAWPIYIGVFIVDWKRLKPDVVLSDPATRFGLSNEVTVLEVSNSWIEELKPEVQLDFSISISFDSNHNIDAQTYTWIKDLQEPLLVDTTGRAVLPEEYYDPEFYRIELPRKIYE
jgi:hypothetical protein